MAFPPADLRVFRSSFPLHYPDADAAGHVRLTSLLNLLQIQAGEHTQSRGFDYRTNKEAGVFWVLSRLAVRFDGWPAWPCDEMTVDTWARSTRAVFALRDFRFGSGGRWLGRASSAWVLLKDRKPQRPEPWVAIYDQVRAEEPLAEAPAALPLLDSADEADNRAQTLVRQTHAVHADWEDLDMNGHVNNVNGIGWCLAQHDLEFLSQWRPESLEANFLAEMFSEQKFMVAREETSAAPGKRTFDYQVSRDADQVPTLRLRVTFRKFS
jgi:acyl-ACP thioesterase